MRVCHVREGSCRNQKRKSALQSCSDKQLWATHHGCSSTLSHLSSVTWGEPHWTLLKLRGSTSICLWHMKFSCGLMVWPQVSCLPLHSRKPNTTFDSHLSNRDFVYEKAKWSNIQTFCNSLCVFPYDPCTTRVAPAESCVFASSEAWSVSRLSLFSVVVMALAACWGLISTCGNLDI